MFFIAPIICGIFYSFTDYNGINKKLNFVGWSNYKTVFSNSRFTKALLFNAKYSTMLVICILALSMILALILNSNLKGKTFFRGAFFFPAVLPLLTMGLVFCSGVAGTGDSNSAIYGRTPDGSRGTFGIGVLRWCDGMAEIPLHHHSISGTDHYHGICFNLETGLDGI